MKKGLFVTSVILNVLLIITLVILHNTYRKTLFKTLADATAAEVRLQEQILEELNSEDRARIDGIKETLHRNIENGKQASDTWRKAADKN